MKFAEELRAIKPLAIPDNVKEDFKHTLRANAIVGHKTFTEQDIKSRSTKWMGANGLSYNQGAATLVKWLESEGFTVKKKYSRGSDGIGALRDDGIIVSWLLVASW